MIYKIASIAASRSKTIVVMIVFVLGIEPTPTELSASSTALGTHFHVIRRVTMTVQAPTQFPSPMTAKA